MTVLLPGMPEPFQRIEASIARHPTDPLAGDSPADAAMQALLPICRELTRDHPEWAEAFDALARHLGY